MYVKEEMDQAESTGVSPHALGGPQPEDDVGPDRGYRVPFGKFARKAIEEIDLDELRSYIEYLESEAKKKNKPIVGQVVEFIERASTWIAACENGNSDQSLG